MQKPKKNELDDTYLNIREIIENARRNTYRAINKEMVLAYWNIGRTIVELEQGGSNRAAYGKSIIKELSKRLTAEFGAGFNERNLWFMRSFHLVFPKVNALRSELTWTQTGSSASATWTTANPTCSSPTGSSST